MSRNRDAFGNGAAKAIALNCRPKNQATKQLLDALEEVEVQAIQLVGLLAQQSYVTVEDLAAALEKQKIGKVEFSNLISFLSGAISGQAFESRFKHSVFGDCSTDFTAEANTMLASLYSLIHYIDQTGKMELPDRKIKPLTEKSVPSPSSGEKSPERKQEK